MSNITNDAAILIKDVKPGSKNLNIVFIVLEIGKLLGEPSDNVPLITFNYRFFLHDFLKTQ